MSRPLGEPDPHGERGGATEVFTAFLKLGLTSFGGPIAHLGYFRDEFVVRRRWVNEAEYADLVALCQFLPGPASSQVGFALGLHRGGPLGAFAAWVAFTLPSALLMLGFAYGATALGGAFGLALIHGLKLVAVAIVAHAVLGMALSLTPDRRRASIAVGAIAVVTLLGGAMAQIGAIALGAVLGLRLCGGPAPAPVGSLTFGVSRGVGLAFLALFLAVLLGAPILAAATGHQGLALFDAFYRSGALVFGGGHVVLPLLQAEVVAPGWASHDEFLVGYGAVQAAPGPLFTFAAFLGAVVGPQPNGPAGAAIALVGVFLPGFLILLAALPFWDALRLKPAAQAALRGANAAVVGILAAALYDPVWTSAVLSPVDFAIAAAGLVALVAWKAPPWTVVVGITAAAVAASSLG